MRSQSGDFGLDESGLTLLLSEIDHRIRNLLTMIEAAVKQTHSTSVGDYRAKLMARISSLYSFCEFTSRYSRRLGLAQLREQTMRPYCANSAQAYCRNSAQVLAVGPGVELETALGTRAAPRLS
jgi:two-component sensor histidine kinase